MIKQCKDTLPRHIAIVMDGNGRWAKQRNLPRIAGHKVGVDSVRAIVESCSNKGVEVLSLFAFSSENWNRPTREVNFLMRLFLQTINKEIPRFQKHNIRFQYIGDLSAVDQKLQARFNKAQEVTSQNTGLRLIIALNYSGRWDITQAVRKLGSEIENGTLKAQDITSEKIAKNICLSELPEPDLFIRTSGELRLSNFMLWQLAYTELYFTDIFWPDFREAAFEEALTAYATRDRRFGTVS